MKFENKTLYGEEELRDFNLYHVNHRFLSYAILVLLVFLFVTSIYNFFVYADKSFLFYAFLYLLILIANYLVNYLIVCLAVRTAKKKDATLGHNENRFCFYEDKMTVQNQFGNVTLKYEELQKVKSNRKYYFFYIHPNTAFVMKKSNFTKGTLEDFIPFIAGKVSKASISSKSA